MIAMKPNNQKNYGQSRKVVVSERDVPLELTFTIKGKVFNMERGRFLGKGSFACCFELISKSSKWPFAVKSITKEMIDYRQQSGKVS